MRVQPGTSRGPLTVVLLLLAVVATSAAGGQPDFGGRVSQTPGGVEVLRDVVYARYGSRALRLDLYRPAEAQSQPVPGIVVIRGGGWRLGDKEGFAAVASALAGHGLAAASIEYRSSDEAPWPAALNDAKAAVRWMRASGPDYGIDPGAIGAIGGSAGAHLVALLATTHKMDDLDGEGGNPDVSNRIQAAVAMAAPSDLTRDFPAGGGGGEASSPVQRFLGKSHREDPDLWALASPITHVHPTAAPMLLIHSDSDRTVPPSQSVALLRRYHEQGAVAELVTIAGAPHAFWNWNRWFDEGMEAAASFFGRHLRK